MRYRIKEVIRRQKKSGLEAKREHFGALTSVRCRRSALPSDRESGGLFSFGTLFHTNQGSLANTGFCAGIVCARLPWLLRGASGPPILRPEIARKERRDSEHEHGNSKATRDHSVLVRASFRNPIRYFGRRQAAGAPSNCDVRFTPESGRSTRQPACPLWANSELQAFSAKLDRCSQNALAGSYRPRTTWVACSVARCSVMR